jgi:hypothetical protein
MKSEILEAKYGSNKTPLTLGNIKLPCYVLNDRTRVFSGRGIQKALGAPSNSSGTWLSKFMKSSPITEFLNPGVLNKIDNVIKFKRHDAGGSQSITYGYEVTLLVDICDAILQANKTRHDIPNHIVQNAEIIIRSVAKVGIIALVDEVTGYQEAREKDELARFLAKFIKEERGVYIKTYPDDFFEALFKMKGLNWSLANKGKKPQYIGHYINNYVYARIAPKVLEELRRVNPKDENGKRKGKHTQYIDVDYGHPKLKEHLTVLTAFAKAVAYNWHSWQRLVERALPKFECDGSVAPELDLIE